MLNFLNPPDRDNAHLDSIINNMGTFYNMFDYQSKERLKSYFNSLLVSLEGLYYNLAESSECYDLNGALPYLDFSYNEFELNSDDAETESLEIPTLDIPTLTGTAGTEDYNYAVTAVDLDGTETPISNIRVIHNGPDILSGTDKVGLEWNLIEGATSYKVYGRTVANLDLIGSSETNTFEDVGQSLTAATPPTTNDTLWCYLIDIPLDYKFFNITYIGDLVSGTDFTIDKFTKLKINNITAFRDTHKKYIIKGAYAFLPILLSLYIKSLTNSLNYMQLLYDESYTGYLDEAHIDGNNNDEALNKKWGFHLTKLFHNISLLTRRALNITNLEKILSLIYNAPFAYEAGTVGNISTGGGYTTFTIGDYFYKIPDALSLLKSNGQSVEKYEILVSTITIEDAYITGTSVSPTDAFNENRLIEITIPAVLNGLGKHSLLVDSFYNNILPKNLEII